MPSGSALLARARQVALGGYDHQAVPFERVVEALHPERSLGHSPLFQAMLALQGSERELVPGLGLAGVSGEALDLGSLGSKFDVTLSLAATAEGGLTGSLEYDSDLFGAATMARLGAQLAAALRGLAQAPARPLWRLELVDASPARIGPRPVRRGGGGDAASVVSLVEAQVLLRPGSVAVEGGGEGLSYGALWSRSGTLAARLRGLGVGPDRVVGLCLDRAVGTVVSVLAVWRAGGAYVALDPTYPDARLDYLIRDSGAVAVLSRGGDAARIEGLLAADPGSRRVAVLDLDRFDDNDAGPLSALPDPPHPDALAYVIYTSGSTGQPKPVAVSHAGLLNHTRWLNGRYGLGPHDRVVLKTPLSFDASVWELISPLGSGATLVVAPTSVPGDVAALARLLADEAIAVVQVVPSLLAALLRMSRAGRGTGVTPGVLRWRRVAAGFGAALPRAAARGVTAQSLRSDRGDHRRDRLVMRCGGCGGPGIERPDWLCFAWFCRACAGRTYAGGSGRDCGGVVFGRGWSGAWVSGPRRSDGDAFCGGSVWRGWGSAVPDG